MTELGGYNFYAFNGIEFDGLGSSPVSAVRNSAWDVTAPVANAASFLWDATNSVASTFDPAWFTRQEAATSLATSFDVTNATGNDLTASWDAHNIGPEHTYTARWTRHDAPNTSRTTITALVGQAKLTQANTYATLR